MISTPLFIQLLNHGQHFEQITNSTLSRESLGQHQITKALMIYYVI